MGGWGWWLSPLSHRHTPLPSTSCPANLASRMQGVRRKESGQRSWLSPPPLQVGAAPTSRRPPNPRSPPAAALELRPASPHPHRGAPPPSLPCWRGGLPRSGALRAPSAPPPVEVCGCPGVYSCLPAAAALSRVLGRRSAPDSGSNCGPGVRQPSSRGRGPDPGALERRPRTRGAEDRPPSAEGQGRREHRSPGGCGRAAKPPRSCSLSCGNLRWRTEHAQHRRLASARRGLTGFPPPTHPSPRAAQWRARGSWAYYVRGVERSCSPSPAACNTREPAAVFG